MNFDVLSTFLGWCLVFNVAILLFSTLAVVLLKDRIATMHAKMLKLDKAEVSRQYFAYLANYKILVLVFNLTPYLALHMTK